MSDKTAFNVFYFVGGLILCICAFGWLGGIGLAMLSLFACSR